MIRVERQGRSRVTAFPLQAYNAWIALGPGAVALVHTQSALQTLKHTPERAAHFEVPTHTHKFVVPNLLGVPNLALSIPWSADGTQPRARRFPSALGERSRRWIQRSDGE